MSEPVDRLLQSSAEIAPSATFPTRQRNVGAAVGQDRGYAFERHALCLISDGQKCSSPMPLVFDENAPAATNAGPLHPSVAFVAVCDEFDERLFDRSKPS